MAFDWSGSAFVVTPGNVPATMVPNPPIRRLFIQVAHGTRRNDLDVEKLAQLRRAGFELCAWAWCNGDDVGGEARLHATLARSYPAFVANQESEYDAHGNSSDPKFLMPSLYLQTFLANVGGWTGALGITTTPKFGSHMGPWQQAGAVVLPQAFPTAAEGGHSVAAVVGHAEAWGWKTSQIRPLVQTYAGKDGKRPDARAMVMEAGAIGVGVTPYTIEQALEEGGFPSIQTLRPAIVRPTVPTVAPPPPPPPGPNAIEARKQIRKIAEPWADDLTTRLGAIDRIAAMKDAEYLPIRGELAELLSGQDG